MTRVFLAAALMLTTATAHAERPHSLPSRRAEALVSSFVPNERIRGIRTIAQTMPRAEAAEWLTRLLTVEAEPPVRAEILLRLGTVADASTLGSFARFVGSDRAIERRLAFLGLAVLGTPEALDIIVSGLLSEGTRPDALAALRRLDAVPTLRLLRALAATSDPHLAESYLEGLGALRDPRAIDAIEAFARSAPQVARAAADLAVARIRGERSVPLSTIVPEALVPTSCFVAKLADSRPESFSAVRLRLRSGAQQERAEAALALASDPHAAVELESALDDDSASVRLAVAFALSRNEVPTAMRTRLRARAAMEVDDVVAMLLLDAVHGAGRMNHGVVSLSMLDSCLGEGAESVVREGADQ